MGPHLSSLASYLATNPWVFLSSVLLAVIAVLLHIIFYRKAERAKKPRYDLRSDNLVSDLNSKFGHLKVSYGAKEVTNLTVTKVAFWNHGRDPIRQADIATQAPIAIKTRGTTEILDAKVVHFTTEANRFAISAGKDACKIGFEYLGDKDGAIVQLLHTGRSSQDIDLVGTVIGAGKPVWARDNWIARALQISARFLDSRRTVPKPGLAANLPAIVMIAGAVTMVAAALILWINPSFLTEPSSPASFSLGLGSAGALYLIIGIGLLRSRVPGGLRKFYEPF